MLPSERIPQLCWSIVVRVHSFFRHEITSICETRFSIIVSRQTQNSSMLWKTSEHSRLVGSKYLQNSTWNSLCLSKYIVRFHKIFSKFSIDRRFKKPLKFRDFKNILVPFYKTQNSSKREKGSVTIARDGNLICLLPRV